MKRFALIFHHSQGNAVRPVLDSFMEISAMLNSTLGYVKAWLDNPEAKGYGYIRFVIRDDDRLMDCGSSRSLPSVERAQLRILDYGHHDPVIWRENGAVEGVNAFTELVVWREAQPRRYDPEDVYRAPKVVITRNPIYSRPLPLP